MVFDWCGLYFVLCFVWWGVLVCFWERWWLVLVCDLCIDFRMFDCWFRNCSRWGIGDCYVVCCVCLIWCCLCWVVFVLCWWCWDECICFVFRCCMISRWFVGMDWWIGCLLLCCCVWSVGIVCWEFWFLGWILVKIILYVCGVDGCCCGRVWGWFVVCVILVGYFWMVVVWMWDWYVVCFCWKWVWRLWCWCLYVF